MAIEFRFNVSISNFPSQNIIGEGEQDFFVFFGIYLYSIGRGGNVISMPMFLF